MADLKSATLASNSSRWSLILARVRSALNDFGKRTREISVSDSASSYRSSLSRVVARLERSVARTWPPLPSSSASPIRCRDFMDEGNRYIPTTCHTSKHSVYLSNASFRRPALNAMLPSSFSFSTSFIRFRSFMAGSWPGSNRSADVRCCSAFGNRPPRKRMRPRSVSASGELGFNRRASLAKE